MKLVTAVADQQINPIRSKSPSLWILVLLPRFLLGGVVQFVRVCSHSAMTKLILR